MSTEEAALNNFIKDLSEQENFAYDSTGDPLSNMKLEGLQHLCRKTLIVHAILTESVLLDTRGEESKEQWSVWMNPFGANALTSLVRDIQNHIQDRISKDESVSIPKKDNESCLTYDDALEIHDVLYDRSRSVFSTAAMLNPYKLQTKKINDLLDIMATALQILPMLDVVHYFPVSDRAKRIPKEHIENDEHFGKRLHTFRSTQLHFLVHCIQLHIIKQLKSSYDFNEYDEIFIDSNFEKFQNLLASHLISRGPLYDSYMEPVPNSSIPYKLDDEILNLFGIGLIAAKVYSVISSEYEGKILFQLSTIRPYSDHDFGLLMHAILSHLWKRRPANSDVIERGSLRVDNVGELVALLNKWRPL